MGLLFGAAASIGIILVIVLIVIDEHVGLDMIGRSIVDRVRSVNWNVFRNTETKKRVERTHWKCFVCGKTMHRGIKSDHLRSHHPEEDDSENRNVSQSSESFVSRGDLVDDYEIDWDTDEEDQGIELQEPTGRKSVDPERCAVYCRVTRVLDSQHGQYSIRDKTHIGSYRGGHILQRFKSLVRRHPEDELDNYRIENDGNGKYPIVIERK